MLNYNFLNLSPPEFEDLTKDLLQKQLDITLESFTSGRDNGIDLRYSLSPIDNLIIQCKRYKDYNSLIGNLKKEVLKVERLKPKRYIISTTLGLTPNQKDNIVNIFSPYILNTSDIFGLNDLNNLLCIFPDIEKQHFKLWLSSTNILDKILHSKIYNQSNFEEKIIKETINLYVDNESYYNANKIIKEKKYVIISGIPGIGKTTLARILVYHYLANGFEEFVFLSDSINEAFSIYKEGVKQIFLFDDFLGTNFLENKLDNNEEQRIVRFIERVSKSKDKIIILTTREYILAQAKQKYDAFNSPSLEFAKCIIDLSHYTQIVKAKILYNHLFFSNLSENHLLNLLKTETYKIVIQHPNYNPRIIETITNDDIWKTIDPLSFSDKFLEFIKNPKSVWKHVFENQISKLSQCVLANLMTAGTPILLEELKLITQNFAKNQSLKYGIIYGEIELKKTIKELENTFIKINKDNTNQLIVEYQNPSVQDFLVFYFRDFSDYVTDILNSILYFNQIFKIFSFENDFEFAIGNRILLNEEQINILINKLLNNFDNLDSTVIIRHSSSIKKEHFSDYTKMNQIVRAITIDHYPKLKDLLIERFEKLMFPKAFQLHHEEIKSYVNLVQSFQFDIEFNAFEILNHISESIIDINDFEEFEKLEEIFGDDYLEITCEDNRHRKRIITLLEMEAENVDSNYLDETLAEIISRAEKYKIDYSGFKESIEIKIENKKNNDDDSYDWDSENMKKPKSQNDVDNETIKDLFDSLRTEETNGG